MYVQYQDDPNTYYKADSSPDSGARNQMLAQMLMGNSQQGAQNKGGTQYAGGWAIPNSSASSIGSLLSGAMNMYAMNQGMGGQGMNGASLLGM